MSREPICPARGAEQDVDMHYPGKELELFATACIWRAYWHAQIAPFVCGRVLEVGAGLGTNTQSLARGAVERWIALEPDPAMAGHLETLARAGSLPHFCEPRLGVITDISAD